MNGIRRRIAEPTAEDVVGGEMKRIVVGTLHVVDRVAEVTGDPFEFGGELGQVEAVDGGSRADGHGSVTIDAEGTDRSFGLSAAVHRDKDGVVRRVGVHAPRPFLVVPRVASRAGERVEQLVAVRVGVR